MEDDLWRAVRQRVPEILQAADAMGSDVIDEITLALASLGSRRLNLSLLNSGVVRRHLNAFNIEALDSAMILERARYALARHNEFHHMAFRVFSLYGEHDPPPAAHLLQMDHGLLPGDPLWEAWFGRYGESQHLSAAVARTLRSAMAYDQATRDAASVSRKCPVDSPRWTEWIRAAHDLAVRAEAEVTTARDQAVQMHDSVVPEYGDVTAILDSY